MQKDISGGYTRMADRAEQIKEETYYKSLTDLIWEALLTDGAHHKQWWIEAIAVKIGIDLDFLSYDEGIAP
jgi:hypothetical protein